MAPKTILDRPKCNPKVIFPGIFFNGGGYLYWTLVGHIEKCCTAMFMRISGLKSVDGCQEIKPFFETTLSPCIAHCKYWVCIIFIKPYSCPFFRYCMCIVYCIALQCVMLHHIAFALCCISLHLILHCNALHIANIVSCTLDWIALQTAHHREPLWILP